MDSVCLQNTQFVVDPYAGELSIVGITGADSEGLLIMYNPLETYQWSTICSTQWEDSDAEVACRQLGYQGGHSKTYRYVWRKL